MNENEKEKNKRGKADPVVKKLICSHCKRIFPSRPNFNKHIEEVHLKLSKKRPATVKRAGWNAIDAKWTLKKNCNIRRI